MRFEGLIAGCLMTPTMAFAANTALDSTDTPADTYFSIAVTENSHNHAGENLLFLDFQSQLDSTVSSSQQVVSPRVTDNQIQLDADLSDWQPEQFSTVAARVMNNYPLSEFYDAVPNQIKLASAYDSQYIYFAVQFEDANHDASINRNRWIYDGSKWTKQSHQQANPAAPTSKAVNSAERLNGKESEDRLFLMFPIVDKQHNYRDNGLGCAGYCHTNLIDSGNPTETMIGEDVVAMHTSIDGDLADTWHWTSTRSAPERTLKDAHLIFTQGSDSGRKGDPGKSPSLDNDLKKLKLGGNGSTGPAYISQSEFEKGAYNKLGHTTVRLSEDDLLRIEPGMQFAPGSSVPYTIHRPTAGNLGDVDVASHFDPKTKRWTLELKRLLDTGNPQQDRIFTQGQAAIAPTTPRQVTGDSERGAEVCREFKCAACHGDEGQGTYEQERWLFPRIQRTSGSLILKTANHQRQKRLLALAYERDPSTSIPDMWMPAIPLLPQQAEDVAAWLQQQLTPIGR